MQGKSNCSDGPVRLTLRCGADREAATWRGGIFRASFRACSMADDTERSGADKHQPPSLDEFSKRLDAARGEPHAEKPEGGGTGAALGRAMRVASELLAAILVGTLLGWGLDRLTHAEPWFLLLGILFGFAAGVRNLYRAMRNDTTASSGHG